MTEPRILNTHSTDDLIDLQIRLEIAINELSGRRVYGDDWDEGCWAGRIAGLEEALEMTKRYER